MNPTELLLQREMTAEQKAMFQYDMDKARKNPGTMRVLCIFCLHRIYVGQVGLAIVQWIAIVFGIGLVWWVYDLFNVSRMTDEFNDSKARDIAATIMQFVPQTSPSTSQFATQGVINR